MKTAALLFIVTMAIAGFAHSQGADTSIVGSIADGTASPSAPDLALPPFQSVSTVVRRVEVVEAPPMAGLPPVTGTITQTVHLVEDPGLPDPPPPPLPTVPGGNPSLPAGLGELTGNHPPTQVVFVSATVYDHTRTFLRWHLNGDAANAISGWSNLDFNHFCGFGSYQVKGPDGEIRRYSLLMGIGDVDTVRMSERLQRSGRTYQAPEHPQLPDLATNGPAFVVSEGDTSDSGLMAVIEGMNDLYRVEGDRMAAACEARITAYEQRKAYLLAHPPKPADVTVSFWNRDHPLRKTPAPETEGGGQ